MNDYGEKIAPDALRFERLFPGPIERVWSYFVESEKRGRWLCSGETELEVGGKVTMNFHNASLSTQPDIPPPEKHKDLPEKQTYTGTVTACDPPRLLSHTWEFEGEFTEVTYELSEQDDQVRLVLTHRRISSREDMLGIFGGWHTHLEVLADVIAGREPRPFWTRYTKYAAEYENRLDAD